MDTKTSVNLETEALSHSRRKRVLQDFIPKINIHKYKGRSFEYIFTDIYHACKKVKGLGMLTTYDISSGICKHYSIPIDTVYIIGNGPKRAIELLGLETRSKRIHNIKVKYVHISDVINAFENKKYDLADEIKNTKNGDLVESFLCKWQKTIN